MRFSPIIQTGQAFAAYLHVAKPNTPLASTLLYEGVSGAFDGTQFSLSEPIALPNVIVAAHDMRQMGLDSGLYEGRLTFSLETQIDDDEAVTSGTHAARVQTLRDLLDDFSAVTAAVNKPTTGPDARIVNNFTLSALVFQDERPDRRDRHLVTDLTYYVFVCPQDPAL